MNYFARRRAARRRFMSEWATRNRTPTGEPEPVGGPDASALAAASGDDHRLPFELLDVPGLARALAAEQSPNGHGAAVRESPALTSSEDPPAAPEQETGPTGEPDTVVGEAPRRADPPEPEGANRPAVDIPAPALAAAPEPPRVLAPRPTHEEQLYQAARRAWDQRDLYRAASLYRELLAANARHLGARNNLALVLDELGEHEQSLEELDTCLALQPESLQVRINRSAVLAALGRYTEAEHDLLDALEREPENGEAYYNLGLVKSRRGRWGDAATYLTRAIALEQSRAAAHFYLGEALNHVDDLPGALQAYQRAVELKPNNPKALYGMGIVLDRMNRPDEAAQAYRRSRECRSNGPGQSSRHTALDRRP
jgi:Flp pilus assembly protein TadD